MSPVEPDKYDGFARNVYIVIIITLLTPLLVLSIAGPICAAYEVNELLCEYDALQKLVNSQQDFDKIAIMQRAVDYNTSVAKITASLQTYGVWSRYIGANTDALQYIVF